jgi:hypothetical protein
VGLEPGQQALDELVGAGGAGGEGVVGSLGRTFDDALAQASHEVDAALAVHLRGVGKARDVLPPNVTHAVFSPDWHGLVLHTFGRGVVLWVVQ